MTLEELKALTFRAGILVKRDFGYLLACDPKMEEDSPHAKLVVLHDGQLAETWMKFNAHSICAITRPSTGLVAISSDGFFSVFSRSVETGNIFKSPDAGGPHYGSLRSVATIDGRAYAVGLRGCVFALDDSGRWSWSGKGLPEEVNLEAIDGYGIEDLFAVGFRGEIWHFNGKVWESEVVPTNVNLTSVLCTPEGVVYAAGHSGTLLRGSRGMWEILAQEVAKEDLWDLEWFGGRLFASSLGGVYSLNGNALEPVNFGATRPESTYRLSATRELLWSVGEGDVMAYDGAQWRRVV